MLLLLLLLLLCIVVVHDGGDDAYGGGDADDADADEWMNEWMNEWMLLLLCDYCPFTRMLERLNVFMFYVFYDINTCS